MKWTENEEFGSWYSDDDLHDILQSDRGYLLRHNNGDADAPCWEEIGGPFQSLDSAQRAAETYVPETIYTLTEDDAAAIMTAVFREVRAGAQWTTKDLQDRTVIGLCSANQDALIDDLWEDKPDDRPHQKEMRDLVRVYDRLLGTSRAQTDLPPTQPAEILA